MPKQSVRDPIDRAPARGLALDFRSRQHARQMEEPQLMIERMVKLASLRRRPLPREGRRSSINTDGLVHNDYWIQLCNAHEDIPIVYSSQAAIQQSDAQETAFTNDHACRHHREIEFQ